MTTLRDILARANRWMPPDGWLPHTSRVIGRDILCAREVRERWEAGDCYLNPGRDAATARCAAAELLDQISASMQDLDNADRDQADFILACTEAVKQCEHFVLIKILLYDDRIEVFTGDDRPAWPTTAKTPHWPEEWTFYRMIRHIQWSNEPESAGPCWSDWPERGPCSDGSWPRLYSFFIGCVCCTNGLFLPMFKRVWSCALPKVALGLRTDGGIEEVLLPNLPTPPTSPLALHHAAKRLEIEPSDLTKWKYATKAYNCVMDLLRNIRLLEMPGELVRRSQTEGWSLEEQFAAEEIAGFIAFAILEESRNPGLEGVDAKGNTGNWARRARG